VNVVPIIGAALAAMTNPVGSIIGETSQYEGSRQHFPENPSKRFFVSPKRPFFGTWGLTSIFHKPPSNEKISQ